MKFKIPKLMKLPRLTKPIHADEAPTEATETPVAHEVLEKIVDPPVAAPPATVEMPVEIEGPVPMMEFAEEGPAPESAPAPDSASDSISAAAAVSASDRNLHFEVVTEEKTPVSSPAVAVDLDAETPVPDFRAPLAKPKFRIPSLPKFSFALKMPVLPLPTFGKNYRIPIATKIIALTVSIVIGATALIARQSSDFFRKVMIQREDYSNMSEAAARAKEVENLLSGALERSQIVATLLAQHAPDDQLNLNFNKDKNLVSVEVWKVNGARYEYVARKTKDEFFTAQKLDSKWINTVRQKTGFPMASVAQKNIEIRNSTIDPKVPLLTMGFPLGRDENDQVMYVALVDLQMGLLQKPFANQSERVFYLIDRNGSLIAHQDENLVLNRKDLRRSPIVEKALADQTPRRQTRFTDPDTNETFIGAYVKSPFWGVTVVAQTAEEVILEPAREVQRKAYYISGIVISVALFLCFLFSMTLTSPLERLAEMIQVVSKGNFDVRARDRVKSRDEVGDLATAFDNMTEGLKERDKVKNLFSKFHGSSVAEDLIKNDIGVGGTRKDVTVFFSDIRGFTAFSEGHTPEEVVTMLNEYFGIMVGIINRNGGVVDKFIGDAIMAIWGAPHASERDTHNALKACLEMRTALNSLNELRYSRGQTAIKIGIGLHCGPAISGTIGSEERMEYTVIGDTVNMTSRIEASTKAFGTDLLISDDVFNKVGAEFVLESAGSAEVKGKSEPLKLYKVRGTKDAEGNVTLIRTPYSDYEAEGADKVKLVG